KRAINTWTFPELVFVSLILGIIYSFLDLIGLWDVWKTAFSEGRVVMVRYLTKPANFFLQLFGENFYVGDLLRVALYILIMAYVIFTYNVPLYPNIFYLLMFFIFGFIVMLLLLLIAINTFLLYDQSARAVPEILWSFLGYASIPVDAAKDIAGFILNYIIPVAFIALIPAKAFFEGTSIIVILSYIFIVIALVFINYYMWKKALRKFEAVGG
ncbi:MAG: ABC-2 family transporter protein, partial [Candidatus Anstonellales archaeon]